jgi:hypothetical protein
MQPGRAITRKGRMDRDCLGGAPGRAGRRQPLLAIARKAVAVRDDDVEREHRQRPAPRARLVPDD